MKNKKKIPIKFANPDFPIKFANPGLGFGFCHCGRTVKFLASSKTYEGMCFSCICLAVNQDIIEAGYRADVFGNVP